MTEGPVRVEPHDGVSVVVLSGEVDAAVAPGVAGLLKDVVRDASAVVLDLAAVDFLDSAGVRLVDQLARGCAGRDVAWRVVAPVGSTARRVLGLVELVGPEVVEDRGGALSSLRAAAGG